MISLRKAQSKLGFSGDKRGRALCRHLRRRERDLGTKFVYVTDAGYQMVDLRHVRLMCAEFREGGQKLFASELRQFARKIRKERDQAIHRYHQENVAPQIDELFEKSERMQRDRSKSPILTDDRTGEPAQTCPNLPTNEP